MCFIINFLNSIGLDIVNLIPTYKLDDDGNKLFDSLFIKHKISKSKELEFVLESDGTMNLVQILINVFIVKMIIETIHFLNKCTLYEIQLRSI